MENLLGSEQYDLFFCSVLYCHVILQVTISVKYFMADMKSLQLMGGVSFQQWSGQKILKIVMVSPEKLP